MYNGRDCQVCETFYIVYEILFQSISLYFEEREEETKFILNKYWEDLIEGNENLRYSIHSKEAFRFLSKVFKYNLFEKRDDAIASSVIVNGNVIKDEAVVHRLIMESLKKTQVDPRFPTYDDVVPFPYLDVLDACELDLILGRMWPGKTLTKDFVSDNIFNKENSTIARQILRDLWSELEIRVFHFYSRLVPLNKKFPEVPSPD